MPAGSMAYDFSSLPGLKGEPPCCEPCQGPISHSRSRGQTGIRAISVPDCFRQPAQHACPLQCGRRSRKIVLRLSREPSRLGLD